MLKALLILMAILSFSTIAGERAPAVALSGVLGSKVILNIDGERRIIADGEETPEGVLLISHDHEKATVKVQGKELVVELGAAPVRSNYQAQEASKEVKVFQDRYGMYRTVGLINGRVANFLVDTGASTIAMSTRKAKSLGIDFIKLSKGKRLPVGTANGTAYAYPVILDTVSVGGIEAKFIRASIIEGDATDEILLGMSYLSRLNVAQQQGTLTLQAK